ncbi:MAG: ROK family protein [Rhizomicrobium sp.]
MRFGVDLGGTKIEVAALSPEGEILLRERTPTPRNDYDATVRAITGLVLSAEQKLGTIGTVGVAIPGTISPRTGLVKTANSTRLIGHPLDKDLSVALGRDVRLANVATCVALSEASDGAAEDAAVVFGIIAGTGVGGGVVVNKQIIAGAHFIAGEWGHNPLPGARPDEIPGPQCYCGKRGCIEAWCAGPFLEAQYETAAGRKLSAREIAAAAEDGEAQAAAALDRWLDRFARSIATLVNILDPDAIVMGGGLSNIDALYRELPARVERYAFTPEGPTCIVRNKHGDSSGVRGAAWLWHEGETGGLPR